ncbi:MAG: hypothetical protein CFE33_04255 [Pseudorhodobacter sp. PARRP1]|nr:MAG: hypothetical protein CFE33_04255 [Pseudorhodobacter sp. PARRP1]
MEATTFAIAATERQLSYARSLAQRNGVVLPWDVQLDRRSLSTWIDAQAKLRPMESDGRPSSKQVAFAEKIARYKRRAVPDECFRDRQLLARWIDSNR